MSLTRKVALIAAAAVALLAGRSIPVFAEPAPVAAHSMGIALPAGAALGTAEMAAITGGFRLPSLKTILQAAKVVIKVVKAAWPVIKKIGKWIIAIIQIIDIIRPGATEDQEDLYENETTETQYFNSDEDEAAGIVAETTSEETATNRYVSTTYTPYTGGGGGDDGTCLSDNGCWAQ